MNVWRFGFRSGTVVSNLRTPAVSRKFCPSRSVEISNGFGLTAGTLSEAPVLLSLTAASDLASAETAWSFGVGIVIEALSLKAPGLRNPTVRAPARGR